MVISPPHFFHLLRGPLTCHRFISLSFICAIFYHYIWVEFLDLFISSSPTEIMAAPKIDSQHNLITIHFNILEMREHVFDYASVN